MFDCELLSLNIGYLRKQSIKWDPNWINLLHKHIRYIYFKDVLDYKQKDNFTQSISHNMFLVFDDTIFFNLNI